MSQTSSYSASQQSVPDHLLQRIAKDILEHTKQLGLFDEIRMRLLADIESSRDFRRLESEFKREIDSFCATVDLSLPRAQLRERLDAKTLPKSTSRLKDHVTQVSLRHQPDLRRLYDAHAAEILKETPKVNGAASVASKGSTKSTSSSAHSDNHLSPVQIAPVVPASETKGAGSSSSGSSSAKKSRSRSRLDHGSKRRERRSTSSKYHRHSCSHRSRGSTYDQVDKTVRARASVR